MGFTLCLGVGREGEGRIDFVICKSKTPQFRKTLKNNQEWVLEFLKIIQILLFYNLERGGGGGLFKIETVFRLSSTYNIND